LYIANASTALALGTGDFTIEFWYYPLDSTTPLTLLDFRPASTNGVYPLIGTTTGLVVAYYVSTAYRITGTTAVTVNSWNHIAVSRSGGVTRLYLNGAQQGADYNDANSYLCGTNRPIIGNNGFSNTPYANGYMQDIRITAGVGRYSGTSLTLPTYAFISALG
jgi:hypothetical protein